MQDARRVDAAAEPTKRPAEVSLEDLRHQTGDTMQSDAEVGGESAVASQPNVEAHDAMVLTREELVAIAVDENKDVHPLMKVQALAALDMLDPASAKVEDHGTWHGTWPMPSRTEWQTMEALGLKWPTGHHELTAVQAARKEYKWHDMKEADKPAYKEAAKKGWNVWTENGAVDLLSKEASERAVASLRARGELYRLLQPRWVLSTRTMASGPRTSPFLSKHLRDWLSQDTVTLKRTPYAGMPQQQAESASTCF